MAKSKKTKQTKIKKEVHAEFEEIKKVYVVRDTEKVLTVSDEEENPVKLHLFVNKHKIKITTSKDQSDFVFRSKNDIKTIERWRRVAQCLLAAVNVLEKERNL